jgi:hypothetical protein
MIKTSTVENFCPFERIEMRDMRRLNLLVGDSGSGKTALLDAIYLAMGVSPELALRIRAWRNQETFQLSAERPHVDSLWKDLFTSSIRTEQCSFLFGTTSVGFLCSHRPRNAGCRISPPLVHSAHFTSAICDQAAPLRRQTK